MLNWKPVIYPFRATSQNPSPSSDLKNPKTKICIHPSPITIFKQFNDYFYCCAVTKTPPLPHIMITSKFVTSTTVGNQFSKPTHPLCNMYCYMLRVICNIISYLLRIYVVRGVDVTKHYTKTLYG